MNTNKGQRPTSSFYSQDGELDFHDVPLANLGATHDDPRPVPNTDWALFREKQRQHKKSRITILVLTAIVAFLGVGAGVLGTLYGMAKSHPPEVQTKTMMSTLIATTTTTVPPVTETTTTSLPPLTETAIQVITFPQVTTTVLETTVSPLTLIITETLPPVTQTTTQDLTEISLVTTTITTTLIYTTVQTTTSLNSTTKGSYNGQRCTVDYAYGGENLHDLNNDYDLLMVDAVDRAVGNGLELGDDDVLEVAMKSIFQCVVTDVLDLVGAF
ncbi:hypothetical protein VPNG_07283 [Cytospora leucostoma]|uniref:Uncharacterized protein n=1 Tax=Cytospora leucostoma TaxID=1230097 RepID=A0A423WKC7_9PEZI|nr:hypothetical protein VPNG_07283 [Cytospora leucostoma]